MKKHATGNGSSQCVLCADGFGMLGASSVSCVDCHKVKKNIWLAFYYYLFYLSPCAINVRLKLFIINKSYPCAKFVVKIVK